MQSNQMVDSDFSEQVSVCQGSLSRKRRAEAIVITIANLSTAVIKLLQWQCVKSFAQRQGGFSAHICREHTASETV